MFLFLARQLSGLKKIDDPLFSRRYYLLEVCLIILKMFLLFLFRKIFFVIQNLSMVQSFIPAVNLEGNRGCQISTLVLNNLFDAIQ